MHKIVHMCLKYNQNNFLEPHVGEDDGFFQPCSSDTVGIEGVKNP